MAELISQDVVNSVRSADASAFVDVSAPTINTPAAVAANSSVHNVSDPATAASTLDKDTDAAAHFMENDSKNKGGPVNDHEFSKVQSFEKQTENGAHDGVTHGESEIGTRSTTGSVGQSAISDGDFVQNETSEGGPKHGDNAPRFATKKPSGFKAVSVTKNFLAKAGTPVSQLSKPVPDMNVSLATPVSSFASSTARPRLVAKSGSGHKLSMSTQLSSSTKTGPSTGPDPIQVWNRNRVQAPQATPKHLTNEELREQYGIQLASIPIGDGDEKGNKWADIDDEEDDWAPEVIEWSDGSKVNLADAEKAAAEKAKAAAEAKKHHEAANMPFTSAKPTSSLGPKATVLKIGGAAQAKAASDAVHSPGKTSEKPTLVAKPVAPTLVKSPWATLPPVDKISPVPIHTPASGEPLTLQRQQALDGHSGERGSMPWRHAKEIEADDFSRIPRDAPNGVPRELFNSQSGKYEPVAEGRRGSVKRDQNFRPPSVLQRPSPEQDVPIPAPQMPDAEDSSEQHSLERSSITHQATEPRQNQETAQPWRRQTGSWVSNHIQNAPKPSPMPEADGEVPSQGQDKPQFAADQPREDPVAVQKRLMREKREAAIKRRQEEEAKEEAERRERIKKKLEAMGPPPEKKEKEKLSTASSSPATSSAVLPAKSNEETKMSTSVKDEASHSPPKPPIPAAAGPPQQYGMIKVHPSPLANGTQTASLKAGSSPSSTETRPSKPDSVTKSGSNAGAVESRANPKNLLDPAFNEPASMEKGRWGHNINQASKAWERPGEVQDIMPDTSLWASGSARNLGNGDFNGLNALTRGQFRQPQISPDSILPSPQSIPPPGLFHEEKKATPAAVALHSVGSSSKPSPDVGVAGRAAHFNSDVPAHGALPRPPSTQSRTSGLPSPLAHTHTAQSSMPSQPKHFPTLPEPGAGVDAWASFTSNVGDHDTASRAKIIQERNRQTPESVSNNQKAPSRQYNETWKQVTRGEDPGSRHVVNTQTATRTQAQTPVASGIMEENMRQLPVRMSPQQTRPSKFYSFFGQQEHVPYPAIRQYIHSRMVSPPLPPSDSAMHPVFERVSLRPRVRFPGHEREEEFPVRPVVKLPPPKPMPQHPVVAELRGMPPPLRGPAQPLAKTLIWQNRFDGLFNKAPDRKVTESMEFSSSKAQFDILPSNRSAAVNFPQPGQISPVSPRFSALLLAGEMTADEEEALFDGEQGPGSKPPVRVPANKFPANWRAAPIPIGRKVQLSDQQVTSRFIWIVGLEDFQGKKVAISVRLPNMGSSKKIEVTTNNLRNPKFLNKPSLSQSGKPFPKTVRKTRESLGRQMTQQGQSMHPAHQANSIPKPAAAPSAPTTWAKRVSAGI